MREYININLKIIKKHLNLRTKKISKLNKISILQEFKEWNDETLQKEEIIWTLPDLTKVERLNNFCRSIKKQIR